MLAGDWSESCSVTVSSRMLYTCGMILASVVSRIATFVHLRLLKAVRNVLVGSVKDSNVAYVTAVLAMWDGVNLTPVCIHCQQTHVHTFEATIHLSRHRHQQR